MELSPYLSLITAVNTKRSIQQQVRHAAMRHYAMPAVPLAMIGAQDTLARQPTAYNTRPQEDNNDFLVST
jgi:hypothetical protein